MDGFFQAIGAIAHSSPYVAIGLVILALFLIYKPKFPKVRLTVGANEDIQDPVVEVSHCPIPQVKSKEFEDLVRGFGLESTSNFGNLIAPHLNEYKEISNKQTEILGDLKEIVIELKNEHKLQREAFASMMRLQGEMSMSLATALERMQNISMAVERRNRGREQ